MSLHKLSSIGVEISATRIRVSAYAWDAREIGRATCFTNLNRSANQIVSDIANCIFHLTRGSIRTIPVGIAISGQIDSAGGVVVECPVLKWNGVPLVMLLKDRLSTGNFSIYLLNDAAAACLAEWKYGAGRNQKDLACLLVGNACGSAFILNGRLLPGDLGHTVLDPDGDMCACGKSGCIDTFFSGSAVARALQSAAESDPCFADTLKEELRGDDLTTEYLNQLRLNKNPIAAQIMMAALHPFATALANTVELLELPLVILGGAVFEGMRDLLAEFEAMVKAKVSTETAEKLSVVGCNLGSNATLTGAALNARQLFASQSAFAAASMHGSGVRMFR